MSGRVHVCLLWCVKSKNIINLYSFFFCDINFLMKRNTVQKMNNKKIVKSTKLTEEDKFQPTPHMEKWLDTAIELASDSPTEIAQVSKITKQSWYKWLKDVPGFEDWYYASYKRKRNRWIPTLDRIGMQYAKSGEYQFWKDMNKKAGENLDNKTPTMPIQINNFIKSEKDEFGI